MGTTVQKGVRIPEEWVSRLDAIAKALSPHVDLSDAAVLRAVVAAGIEALEAKFALHAGALAARDREEEPKGEARSARKPKPKPKK